MIIRTDRDIDRARFESAARRVIVEQLYDAYSYSKWFMLIYNMFMIAWASYLIKEDVAYSDLVVAYLVIHAFDAAYRLLLFVLTEDTKRSISTSLNNLTSLGSIIMLILSSVYMNNNSMHAFLMVKVMCVPFVIVCPFIILIMAQPIITLFLPSLRRTARGVPEDFANNMQANVGKFENGKITQKGTEYQLDPNDRSCSICLGDYENGSRVQRLGCGHHFDQNCINDWLKVSRTCPYCRANVMEDAV